MRRRTLQCNNFPKLYPPENTIYYTTNDQKIANVHDYWEQPVQNYYDKRSDIGAMSWNHPLTEIPAISGHPFFYSQRNLLTITLPNTVKRLNWGCFYGCSNLYKVNVEDLNLEFLGYGCFESTNIQQLDFRNSTFTELEGQSLRTCTTVDYVLLPQTLQGVIPVDTFSGFNYNETRIKTLMAPSIAHSCFRVENVILENLIITKPDGLAELHHFDTNCVIWVPDEWYDEYVEYYTNFVPNAQLSRENCEDIIMRLRKYSNGVPQFPRTGLL